MVRKLLVSMVVCAALVAGYLFAQPVKSVQATSISCKWGDWVDSSTCIASNCDSSEGTKSQKKLCTKTECDYSCPSVSFIYTKRVVDVPEHWSDWKDGYDHNADENDCEHRNWMGLCTDWRHRHWIENTYKSENVTVNVVYEKSSDPHKCHRPSDDSLRDVYGLDHDNRHAFKQANSEWKNAISSNCHDVTVASDSRDGVACNDAPIVACEEDTDVCENIIGDQAETPAGMYNEEGYCNCREGYHRVERESLSSFALREIEYEDFYCEPNASPSPSTSPTPGPTPNPTPGPGLTKDFWAEPWCDGHVTLHLKYRSGDAGFENVKVRFSYNNETKEVLTNKDGEARVDFSTNNEGKARVEYDGNDHSTDVKKAENCPVVLGATTGQVLGATTMAGTGVFSDLVMNLLGMSGLVMSAIGLKRHAKN